MLIQDIVNSQATLVEVNAKMPTKQDKNDEALVTDGKTIIGAINEVKNINDSQDRKISTLETNAIDVNTSIVNLNNNKMNNTKGTQSDKFTSLFVGGSVNDAKGYTTLTNGWKLAIGTIDLRIDGTEGEIELTLPCSFTSVDSFRCFASTGANNKVVVTAYPTANNKIKIYAWTTTTVGYTYKGIQWEAVGY